MTYTPNAATVPAGMTCGKCRREAHSFNWPDGWGQDDGCPCCWSDQKAKTHACGTPCEHRCAEGHCHGCCECIRAAE